MTANEPADIHAHPDLGEEVRAIGGRYELTEERVLRLEGRDLLVAFGISEVDSSCCGVGGGAFAVVAGYVGALRFARDEHGRPLSRVERVRDEHRQAEIRAALERARGAPLPVSFR